jgi:hypothetical protein
MKIIDSSVVWDQERDVAVRVVVERAWYGRRRVVRYDLPTLTKEEVLRVD